MRERKLRATAESLVRFRGSLIPYTYYIYKIKRKVKGKNTMRICSPSVPRLKHEWNHTVGLIINLRCGTAASLNHREEPAAVRTTMVKTRILSHLVCQAEHLFVLSERSCLREDFACLIPF